MSARSGKSVSISRAAAVEQGIRIVLAGSRPLIHDSFRLTLPRGARLFRAFARTFSMSRISSCSLLLAIALLAAGCISRDARYRNDTLYIGGAKRGGYQPPRANFDNVSYWDGDGVPGAPFVRISLGEQRAYFYKGGQLVGVSIISSGREGFGTSAGTFRLQQKDLTHKSSLYGDYVDRNGGIIRKDVDTSKIAPARRDF